ncbi:MAG: hypothetical protein N2508_11250 [Anaerolineae bacterium]|nr:hypothetical protein [Anaerolineae bacterium]
MESVMLTVKFVLLLAMEVFVVATFVGAIILGIYGVVKEKVRESRLQDELAPQTEPIVPKA